MPSHATFEADNPKRQQAYFTAQTERPQVPHQEYIPLKQVLGSWTASHSRPNLFQNRSCSPLPSPALRTDCYLDEVTHRSLRVQCSVA